MTTAAWYIVPSQSVWARWFNTLHWPYTLWHLSYPVIGTALADQMSWSLLGWTVLAFFLGMGIAAHCFDLIQGDPLRLGLSRRSLWVVALVGLGAAAAIGVWQWYAQNVPNIVIIFVGLGIALASGYNLEWPGLHGDWQFASWWAVFPLLVGYFAQGIDFTILLIPVVLGAFLTAAVQRVLSTRVRFFRRTTQELYLAEGFGGVGQVPGTDLGAGKEWFIAADEKALALLGAAMVVVAAASLIRHL